MSSGTPSCWVCNSAQTTPWKERSLDRPLIPDDLQITDSRYGMTLALRRCGDCGFIFAEPDGLDELTSLYEQLVDPGYEESSEARSLQMERLVRSALDVHPTARSVLDVGAGTGLLVKAASDAGLSAVGVEPSRALVDAGRRARSVRLLHGVHPHPELAGTRFDLIFLVDVIEHVAEPVELLEACASALEDGGALVVVTPDVRSVVARVLGKRWWHLRLAHVGYFTERSLTAATTRAGLTAVGRSRAKWYFRVSYLADRVARYLPVGWLNRLAGRVRSLRWLYSRVVPVDLRDSMVVFLRRQPSTGSAKVA